MQPAGVEGSLQVRRVHCGATYNAGAQGPSVNLKTFEMITIVMNRLLFLKQECNLTSGNYTCITIAKYVRYLCDDRNEIVFVLDVT